MIPSHRVVTSSPKPDNSFNFLNGTLPSGLTFTRASVGNYFNDAGLVVAASNDIPRFDYSNGILQGLLVESAVTNSALRSRDFTQATWIKTGCTALKNAVGADGVTNAANTVTATTSNAIIRQFINKASHNGQFSALVRRTVGSGAISMYAGEPATANLITNGTFDADTDWTKGTGWNIAGGVCTKTAGVASRLEQNTSMVAGRLYMFAFTTSGVSAGTCSLRTSATGGVDGTSLSSSPSGNGTFKLLYNATGSYVQLVADATWNGTVDSFSIYEMTEYTITTTSSYKPFSIGFTSVTNPIIGFKLAVSGDALEIDYVQEETGSFVTSPIETGAATATRSLDAPVIVLNKTSDILIKDKNGAYWVDNQAAGNYTLVARTGQRHIGYVQVWPAGRLSSTAKNIMLTAL